jgi:hypothetical protein
MDKFKSKDGKEIEVSAEGSLGLLALGYRGLIAWRQKRMEVMKQQTSVVKTEEKGDKK